MMIKAIIFDCFGVLCTDGWLPFKRHYFGNDQALFNEAGDLNQQFDAGLMSYDDYLEQVGQLAGVSAAFVRQSIESNPPNEALFNLIAKYKPDYTIGLLSNAGGNWLSDLFTPEQVALFDGVVLSCDIGHTKPQPEAYQAAARKLGIELAECVFIDDQLSNVSGAITAGMSALQYHSADDLAPKLARALK